MKTTIDIPEDVLYRAKVVSAQRKTTFKALVMHGLLMELECSGSMPDAPDPLIDALSKGHNTKPVGRLNREQIHDRKIFY